MPVACKGVFSVSAFALTTLVAISNASSQSTRFDELANSPFEKNRPTQQTVETLKDERLSCEPRLRSCPLTHSRKT